MLAVSEVPRVDARIPSISPSETAVAPFELSAGSYESPALTVLSFRGREAISRAFSFEITVAASPDVDPATIEPDLLGRPACLTMQAGGSSPRLVRGVVAAVSALSVAHGGRVVYRLRIVPALWLLKKRTTSRIFQDKTVPEIVAAVLDKAGVSYALCLIGKYRPRTYCVQHRETDFAFVERLLAEEGIFYTFDHGGPDAKAETVALSDSVQLYPVIEGDPALAYRPHSGAAGMALAEHHVQRFELGRSLRPTSVFRRGYDFRRPALALEAEAKLSDLGGGEPARGEVYEHHEEDEEPNVRQQTVTAELEQHRANVEVAHGESGCRRLVPGARFKLCDHDLGRLDREYVVTDIKHTGWDPQAAAQGQAVYANTFECVPATVAARPRRPARALQQVTETALVVGPEGQEIYTDEYGRVKVQFHWDREGRRDERSSCWIRVSQAWAGSGWGFEFIPRVGMEVVVTFLGGDVDRPLITGCVPNAINKPPFRLPEHKTQSGIRTQSTPGGDGFNELMFEDRKGLEQINLRAERDLEERVGNDHRTVVTRDRDAITGAMHSETIGGNRIVSVGGSNAITVGGSVQATTTGDLNERVGANKTASVGGELSCTVQGRAIGSFSKDCTLHVAGGLSTVVGTRDAPAGLTAFAHGDYRFGSTQTIGVFADGKIVLVCGKSRIEIGPDRITIESKELVFTGEKSASIMGPGPALHLTDEVEIVAPVVKLYAKNASIALGENADVRGKLVRLNCNDDKPTSKDGEPVIEETKPVHVKLADAEFKPYAGKRYQLLVEGRKYEGTTGGDGLVEQQVPKAATSAVVEVWIEEYPTGQRKSWTLKLIDELPPSHSPAGAMERLRNLGYKPGSDEEELDEVTQEAIKLFQRDHEMKPSGELCAATVAALEERHGH